RPHARLAFASALSSQTLTASGRPSEHLRFTESTAALSPSSKRCPPLPKGDVSAAIDVTLIGAPGHGFDGAVVPVFDLLALLELLPLHAVRTSARATSRHAPPRAVFVRRFIAASRRVRFRRACMRLECRRGD